ncbi:MAG TPA: CBS domain-containing protein [Polyangiaceae bacterium]|nr:CBS domain-containing protein [Polyangiaceae bacterium]
MRNLLSLARTPPVVLSRWTRVSDALRQMVRCDVGAAAVVDGQRAIGIFTERDAVFRVLLEGREPAMTPVSDVMTTPMLSVGPLDDPHDARRIMVAKGIRHLPVVDSDGRVVGMLSLRDVMADEIDDLEHQVDALTAFESADGIGG